jgi:hypothetical protein
MSRVERSQDVSANRRRSVWFWGGFVAVLLLGLLIVLFAAIRAGSQWADEAVRQSEALPPVWKQAIRVTLSGDEILYIDSPSLPKIRSETRAWLDARHELIHRRLREAMAHATEAVFAAAAQRIPVFADWYFSLSGEYARLFHAAVGDLPEFLGEHLQTLIFGPAGTAEAVDRMVMDMDRRLADQMRGAAGEYNAMLNQLIRSHRLEAGSARVTVQGDWAPTAGVQGHLESFVSLSAGDIGRQGLATSAGVAASAVAFKKLGAATVAKSTTLIAGKQSAGMLAALAVKLGLKSAVKSGGALTGAGVGAASSAAICSGTIVGAPLAPACALAGGAVTGVATWLLVDMAVLEADELMHREDLENQLRGTLAAQREELRATLEAYYLETLRRGFAQLEQGVVGQPQPESAVPKKAFTPARAAGEG